FGTTRTVLADVAVRADDPVAGDHERDRVVGECRSDGTHRAGPADLARHPRVGANLAARDLHRLAQDGALELGQVTQVDRRAVHVLAGQPSLDLVCQTLRHLVDLR